MAVFDDLVKNPAPGGLVVGVGAALLGPFVVPAVYGMLRPVATVAVRTGMTAYRSAMEPLRASIGSLVAEAQIELATARAGARPGSEFSSTAAKPAAGPAAGTPGTSVGDAFPTPASPATLSDAGPDDARTADTAASPTGAVAEPGGAAHPRGHRPKRGGTHPA